jgi:uncharacterized membrane protein YhdT
MSDITRRFKSAVVAPVLLAPVLGGAILYYPLRRQLPELARFANRLSFVGFIAWAVLFHYLLNHTASDLPFWLGPATFVFGVLHAIVVVRRIKAALRAGDLPPSVARER